MYFEGYYVTPLFIFTFVFFVVVDLLLDDGRGDGVQSGTPPRIAQ